MTRNEPLPPLQSLKLRLLTTLGPRGRRIARTSFWSLVAKVASAANLFLSVPFVLHALGPTEFGVWTTLVSFVALSNFLDFGFGNGTMNLVAAAQGRGAHHEIPIIIRKSQQALAKMAAYVAIGAAVLVLTLPWQRLLGVPDSMQSAARLASGMVLLSIVCAIPLNMANRAQLGLGQGDRAFRWQAAGQLLALLAVVTIALRNGSLVSLTAAAVLTPLLASAGNLLSLRRSLPDMPTTLPSGVGQQYAARIRREGLSFFILQLSAALAYSLDLPLISALRGPEEAGMYSLAQRLFSIIPMTLALVWTPLWPIYRQAFASGDLRWAYTTYKKSTWCAGLYACIAGLALALAYAPITAIWLHRPVQTTSWLLWGLAVACVVDAIGTATAAFLNAASILRYQLMLAVPFAIVTVSLKIYALTRVGPEALPWITLTTYFSLVLLPLVMKAPAIHKTIVRSEF